MADLSLRKPRPEISDRFKSDTVESELTDGVDLEPGTFPAKDPAAGGREKVVIVNQYYLPDIAATGQLLHQLASELVRCGLDVHVLTAPPSYGPRETRVACPAREVRAGVSIRRVWIPRLSKDRFSGRLLGLVTFLSQVGGRTLVGRGDELYVYVTNPPFLGIVASLISLVRRHRYAILLHDAYPEIAVRVGTIRAGGVIERVWRRLNRIAYRRAVFTVVLCKATRKLICNRYGISGERVHVIHNWADGRTLQPKPKNESRFALEHDLLAPFTLLYSGNIGLIYDFEGILEAADALRDERFRLVFIGSGGKRAWLEQQVRTRRLDNVRLFPYQPLERLSETLNACDASLVTIAKGVEGLSFPSKFYAALAVGKPVLALSEPDSELRALVESYDAGCWADIGDGVAVATRVREMMSSPEHCAVQGANARRLFEQRFTCHHAAREFAKVLRNA